MVNLIMYKIKYVQSLRNIDMYLIQNFVILCCTVFDTFPYVFPWQCMFNINVIMSLIITLHY